MAGRPKDKVPDLKSVALETGLSIGVISEDVLKDVQRCKKSKEAAQFELTEALSALDSTDRKYDGLDEDARHKLVRTAETRVAMAHADWERAVKLALVFETKVPEEKRGSGDVITQKDAAKVITLTMTHIRFGCEQAILSICQSLTKGKTEIEIEKLLRPKFEQALDGAISTGVIEGHITNWAEEALRRAL